MTPGTAGMAETAAIAERLMFDFIRLVVLGAAAAWGTLLFIAIVAEAVRPRKVGAGLRELGVGTPRSHARKAPRVPGPREERGTGRGVTPRRSRRWSRGG
jgi:hypothetical protein